MSTRIYEYNTPLVTLKQGNGKIISGSFKLIHVINLESYEDLIDRITTTVNTTHQENKLQPQLRHQLNQITQLISELKGQNTKTKRSVNWIGSAWKWIAGSPDATDWDQVVKSQNQIVKNNNQQYKINKAILDTADKMLVEYNKITDHYNNDSDDKLQQILFNRLLIVKEEVKEIVRAAQLAKAKIINTNLLDKMEINRLITEVETLPYSNEIEAIEYAEPMMMIKNSIILYVISIPKTSEEDYNHIIIRSTIDKNKQIYLEANEILLNQNHVFGIVQKCKRFRDTTICESNCLKELNEDHCINQLIRGADARCELQFNKNQIIERLDGNTIFLTNFNGNISFNKTSKYLKGSFLVQYNNETIKVNNSTFTNKEEKTFQILPSVLRTNITENGIIIDPGYLHNLYLENIEQLQEIFEENKEAAIIDFGIIFTICGLILMVFINKIRARRQRRMIQIQQDEIPRSQPGIQFQPVRLNI